MAVHPCGLEGADVDRSEKWLKQMLEDLLCCACLLNGQFYPGRYKYTPPPPPPLAIPGHKLEVLKKFLWKLVLLKFCI